MVSSGDLARSIGVALARSDKIDFVHGRVQGGCAALLASLERDIAPPWCIEARDGKTDRLTEAAAPVVGRHAHNAPQFQGGPTGGLASNPTPA